MEGASTPVQGEGHFDDPPPGDTPSEVSAHREEWDEVEVEGKSEPASEEVEEVGE